MAKMIAEDRAPSAGTISFGTMSAEYDVFYDHCDGCTRCASKQVLCAEGSKLLEHAVTVAQRDNA